MEDNIEVEELLEPVVALNSPLPPDHPNIVLYVRTKTHRPTSPALHPSIPSMTTAGSMASKMSVDSMQTSIFVQGGGTISIPSITPSTTIFGSTSILPTSGSSQDTAFDFLFIPYGMPSHMIPSVPLNIQSTTSISMMSGSAPFQGFPFGGGHIPHSNPTIG